MGKLDYENIIHSVEHQLLGLQAITNRCSRISAQGLIDPRVNSLKIHALGLLALERVDSLPESRSYFLFSYKFFFEDETLLKRETVHCRVKRSMRS
jgi:hypothetical protein